MKEKPSFWDDYIRVLPWNAVALIILLLFFATLQKHVLVFWSFLTGSDVIALLFIMGRVTALFWWRRYTLQTDDHLWKVKLTREAKANK